MLQINQIKETLYRNYSRFAKMICRADYCIAVCVYIKFVTDCMSADTDITGQYNSVDELCQDFYYCTF